MRERQLVIARRRSDGPVPDDKVGERRGLKQGRLPGIVFPGKKIDPFQPVYAEFFKKSEVLNFEMIEHDEQKRAKVYCKSAYKCKANLPEYAKRNSPTRTTRTGLKKNKKK